MTAHEGLLDGVTLYRFAHMMREQSSGGVESYLLNLNKLLLQRNKMTILQTFLSLPGGPEEITTEKIGRGQLTWIPSFIRYEALNSWGRLRRLRTTSPTRSRSSFKIDHRLLTDVLPSFNITLGVLHWLSEDSEPVLAYLGSQAVPVCIINHFENTYLGSYLARRCALKCVAVGGVTGVEVPSFLDGKFTTLSDGVDVSFFDPSRAEPVDFARKSSVILLAARISWEKGHFDAVRALGLLRRRNIDACLVCAGHDGAPDVMRSLTRVIEREGVEDHVVFLGELPPSHLRSWYATADVVVLPSHTEGLGRVLLEAQAMGKPVVSYDVGGIRVAVRDASSGILVEKGDARALAGRILELLEDPDRRKLMGRLGREHVIARFSLTSLVERHEQFYRRFAKCAPISSGPAIGVSHSRSEVS
jgi:glycosyltransferase involved in cell wall biosynthesis